MIWYSLDSKSEEAILNRLQPMTPQDLAQCLAHSRYLINILKSIVLSVSPTNFLHSAWHAKVRTCFEEKSMYARGLKVWGSTKGGGDGVGEVRECSRKKVGIEDEPLREETDKER